MRTLYPAQAFSPQALLAEIFNSTDTTLTVNDGALLPAPPNLLTLGTYGDAAQETILYTVKTDNVISGITRAVEGTATSWDAGTPVARYYTAKDYDDLRANVDELSNTANRTVAFTAAAERANVATGESLATLWGKVAKWFTDLKAIAFSGSYADLTGAPTSMTPTAHASTHATGQTDAIAPGDIGAAALDADSKVTAAQASAAIVEVTASLTLGSTHYGRMLRCTNSAAITLTMPTDIPVGTEIEVYRAGTGTVTLSAASGVTVECKETMYGVADQYTALVLKWVAANTVAIVGNVG